MPRILLSEGSSLSAKQAMLALGRAGHHIEVCDSAQFCLGRLPSLVALVGSALIERSRTALLRHCRQLLLHAGPYSESVEELTPLRWDRLSAIFAGFLRPP